MKRIVFGLLLLASLAAQNAFAQPRNYRDAGPYRDELRLQTYYFDNFYEAPAGVPKQSMTTASLEYRGAYRPAGSITDFYVHANYAWWFGDKLGSYGGRVGVARESALQSYNVFVSQTQNRPSFEVGNSYARADSTQLSGTYSYHVVPAWEPGIEVESDRQTYDANHRRNNSFNGAGLNLRYDGFGDKLIPRVGFLSGRRHVNDATESYKENQYYAELVSMAIPQTWLSLGYRSQGRNYSIDTPTEFNYRREDSGPSIEFIAAYRWRPRISYSLYFAHQKIDTTIANGDFSTNLAIVGVSFGLPSHK